LLDKLTVRGKVLSRKEKVSLRRLFPPGEPENQKGYKYS